MRIDRYISNNSGYSRSDAKKLIKQQRVTVDGAVVAGGNASVADNAAVAIDNEPLVVVGERYFMLHKPAGYLSANADSQQPVVLDLLQEDNSGLQIAGRLDADTTGLLLITSDGQWNHRVTSPNKVVGKTYLVTTVEPILAAAVERFAAGVYLRYEDVTTKPAVLEIIASHQARLTIHEGKYHQVKRMFASEGNRVVGLHRESIGGLHLDADLAAGEYRALTEQEVALFTD
ncbi:Ribosomal small subunit pseudouridine synthase A [Sinobacterium norvegicum]|uniref:Pseudouridine synthase n=1 Tax=Sinobacterium norvegicum TaxID=1641715 RepID=A0ABM9ACG9_9GAMM|nr:pseudouridine synthase [Sinobacterium norvegicum]CAH0990900.1 Ribosomal small subunit pseudouridine synthase A [Sinobacterium norvegicum]